MKIKIVTIGVLILFIMTGCSSNSSVKIEGVKQTEIFACKQDSDCVRSSSLEEHCYSDIAINKNYSSQWREIKRQKLGDSGLGIACPATFAGPSKSKKAICRFNKCTLSFFSYKN